MKPLPVLPPGAGFVRDGVPRRDDCAVYASCLKVAARDKRGSLDMQCPLVCRAYRVRDDSATFSEMCSSRPGNGGQP